MTDKYEEGWIAEVESPEELIVCCRVRCSNRALPTPIRGMRATLCIDCADELFGSNPDAL